MEKDRLGAFIDAVLAIIMTILVLELPRPETYDVAGLWALRTNFFAYALSFFWLGAMWVNIHQSYHAVEKISQKTIWSAIVMLFFSSFYPYATKLIADAFFNKAMQGLYGVVVLLITFSVLGYYKQLDGKTKEHKDRLMLHKQKWIWIDVILKVLCIGEHAIVGAASVVTKDVPDCAVVVGNPAKVVKMLEVERFK